MTAVDVLSAPIRIATLNLFNFIAPPLAYYEQFNIYSEPQWQQKCHWISRYLAEHQPDIIGFQEVFSVAELQQLLLQAGYPYFVVVDNPELIDAYIYQQPVTALASRYPIVNSDALKVAPQARAQLGLSADFSFSRKPLWAQVNIPGLGLCDCYVVHFKSKRSQFNECENGNINADFGDAAASIQRLAEASLVRSALRSRYRECGLPMILMGDFNDALTSDLLQGLVSPNRVTKANAPHAQTQAQPTAQTSSQPQAQSQGAALQLFDSFHLFEQETGQTLAAIPTHYYGGHGQVLDYILLSQDFAPSYCWQLACVEGYEVFDRHLLRPDYALDSHSTDHGVVMVTVQLRQ
ncbi:MAG: endonuclease/exonuclease/phosphatase family protein [Shewanella sp.]